MKYTHRTLAFAALIGISLAGYLVADKTGGYEETDLVVNQSVNGVPTLEDANGIVHIAKFFDPHLVNPWGVGESSTSFFWISDNGAGRLPAVQHGGHGSIAGGFHSGARSAVGNGRRAHRRGLQH